MILVDTSVWIDHLRRGNSALKRLLNSGEVLTHPFVIGEIACGELRKRAEILELLDELPKAVVAENGEVLQFMERNHLYGLGLGWIDVHLLASAALSKVTMMTFHKTIQKAAKKLNVIMS